MSEYQAIVNFYNDNPALSGLITEMAGSLLERLVLSKIFRTKNELENALKKVYHESVVQFKEADTEEKNIYKKPFYNSAVLAKTLIKAALLDEEIDSLKLLGDLSASWHSYQATENNIADFIQLFKANLKKDTRFQKAMMKAHYPFKIFSIDKKISLLLEQITDEQKKNLLQYNVLSTGTFEDAQIVDDARSWSTKREYIGLDDLYIDRNIEKEIKDVIGETSTAKPILIAGDAGHGKTSLLWKLYSDYKLNESWQPVFLKSIHLPKIDLVSIIDIIKKLEKKPLLLIDTLDLLLHNDNDREVLINALYTASQNDCICVGTSRPQELEELKPFRKSLEYHLFMLGPYDEMTELPLAITKYANIYYENEPTYVTQTITTEILDAVSNDTSLKSICLVPLTQRMLFSIYAPNNIPKEINVFKLYNVFWETRVEKDIRPGKAGQSPLTLSEINLSKVTHWLALLMLAQGTTVLQISEYSTLFRQNNINQDDIQSLASRGVIKYNATDQTLEYFHQTFFEHVSARALVNKLQEQSLNFINNKLLNSNESEPAFNFFIIPIYQQILLLGETSSFRDGVLLEAERLLTSHDINNFRVFAYVYSLFEFNHSRLDNLVLASIKEYTQEETIIIKRFLQVAVNYSTGRVDVLFKILELIWLRNIWNEQFSVILLLNNLATRSPARVLSFLQTTDPVAHINEVFRNMSEREHKNILEFMSCILIKTYNYDKEYCIEQLGRILNEGDAVLNKEILKVALTLKNEYYQPGLIKIILESVITAYERRNGISDLPYATAHLLGELFFDDWKLKGYTLTQVINETEQANHLAKKIINVVAMGLFSETLDETDALVLFNHFRGITKEDLFLTAKWLIPTIFENENTQKSNFARLIVADIKSTFEGAINKKINSQQDIFLKAYEEALNKILFADENILIKELEDLYTNKLNWISIPTLTRLYVISLRGKNLLALELTREDKALFLSKPALGVYLWKIIQTEQILNPVFEKYVIEVLIFLKKIRLLAGIVQSVHNNLALVIASRDLPPFLILLKTELITVAKEKIKSNNNGEKTEAAHLLAALLKLGIGDTITTKEIVDYFPNTRYLQLKSWVVEIWGACSFSNESELTEIITYLEVYFKDEKDFIIAKSHYAYFQLLCKAKFDCSFLKNQILQVCFSDTKSDQAGQKFKYLNRLIINQTEYNPEFGLELLISVLNSELLLNFPDKRQRTISHELRNASVNVCANINLRNKQKFANLLLTTTCEYGRTILEGLMYEKTKFAEIRPRLEAIYEFQKTRICIKNQILTRLQISYQANASVWPELKNLIFK